MGKNSKNSNAAPADFFKGGGEMGERIRQFDWAKTLLGSPETWQQSLKTAVRLMLDSRYPMFVWWGEELICLYNDAYIPILGNRHPNALGLSGNKIWHELWDIAGPQAEAVLKNGEATWNDELPFVMERNGRPEETYVTFSYSPIADDAGNIGGLFCVCNEETQKVLNRRRLKTLRDLGERTLEESKTVEDACRAAAETLAENSFDVSFALLYLLDADGERARLAEAVNIDSGFGAVDLGLKSDLPEASNPQSVIRNPKSNDVWGFRQVLETNKSQTIENLEEKFAPLPAGAWADDVTKQAVVVPLAKAGVQDFPAGFLVAGISPRLEFDKEYRDFIELAAGHIATAIANARALEEERERAESLAELDRAKTEFFSNVSHEFRTPLTLILGNLEDVLRDGDAPNEREKIETAHRNSLRLLKLVNTLLDFSRIEANRQQADFVPTDLAKFTAELASNFRSAIEKAGIKLTVDCPPLSQNIAVDREMWEKIVLNLISNAFKFTFEGEIKISLRETNENAVLQISDTGTGISEENLPHIFERFHRVADAKSRTHEGTGIGLALVKELVKLHDGAISAESEIDKGTTFIVSIPRLRKGEGEKKRKGEKAAQASNAWQSYLLDSEAGETSASNYVSPSPFLPFAPSAKILLADDNADMREYVRRLLEQNGYQVLAVSNGEAALEFLEQNTPDLILTDVMMPRLDGFGLLKKIRNDEQTREIPVIMLSARAGEESKVGGLQAGADDYLIKPFAARELLARVESNLKLKRLRRESKAQVTDILESIKDCFVALDNDWRFVYFNRCAEDYFQKTRREVLGETIWDVFPAAAGSVFGEKYREAVETQEIVRFETPSLIKKDGWVEVDVYPSANGLSIYFRDISERKLSEEKLRQSENQMRLVTDSVPALISYVDAEHHYRFVNQTYTDWFGHAPEEIIGKHVREVLGEAAYAAVLPQMERVLSGEAFSFERLLPYKDGGSRFVSVNYVPDKDAKGTVKGYYALVQDITARKEAEGFLERYRLLSEKAGDIIWMLRPDGQIVEVNQAAVEAYGYSREELLQMNVRDLREPSTLPFFAEQFEKANSGGVQFETVHIRRDGSSFPVEVNATGGDFGGERLILSIVRDITERKWAEAERERLFAENQRQKDFFDRIVSNAPVAIAVMKGSDLEFVSVNAAYQEIMGTDAQFVGRTYRDVFPEAAARGAEEKLREVIRTGQPWKVLDFETEIPGRSETTWWEGECLPLPNEQGESDSVLVLTWEITERKRAEEKTRESEESYRILAETASDAIIRIDENSTIQYVNTAAGRIFGYAAEEMIGQSLTMLMPEEMRERHRAGFGRYLETGKRNLNWESIEVPARHKTGRLFPLEISFGEYNRGGRRFFIGIARDITDRKAAEQALRESEEKFRDLANSISQLAWMADASGHIFWYNERWFEYTGTTLETMQGWGWQAVHHPEEVERVTEKFKRHIASGGIWEDTFPLRSRIGEYRWFLSRALPIRDEQGQIVRWFGTNTDVEELRQARLQAEKANRLKDEFLATVSHELRTPLNAILGWSSMLQAGRADEEMRRRADETIYRSAKSQAQLIEDLLDVSRIISGNLRIQTFPVNLASIVESSIETLRPAAEAKSIKVETIIECEPCRISGDAQRLQQIVWNLLSNAVKFTPEGGTISVRLENENSRARLTVQDSGKGIEAEFLPYIFERFRQQDGSTTRRHSGLGLGLAIVRSLTELHGGTISAESAGVGQGATFTIELPLVSSHKKINENSNNKRESLSDEAAVQASKLLKGVRVLLVDDELDTLELLDAVLTAEGANVRVADSAQEAFEIFSEWLPDVLISDIGMPDEDGYSLIKKVRQLPANKGGITPAIAMTAYGRDEDRMRVLASGFHQYIAKPAEPFELITAIKNLVGEMKS